MEQRLILQELSTLLLGIVECVVGTGGGIAEAVGSLRRTLRKQASILTGVTDRSNRQE